MNDMICGVGWLSGTEEHIERAVIGIKTGKGQRDFGNIMGMGISVQVLTAAGQGAFLISKSEKAEVSIRQNEYFRRTVLAELPERQGHGKMLKQGEFFG